MWGTHATHQHCCTPPPHPHPRQGASVLMTAQLPTQEIVEKMGEGEHAFKVAAKQQLVLEILHATPRQLHSE